MQPFASQFHALTGNHPFPWQQALYERLISDRPDNIPESCRLPTGMGKTSVIAIWMIAREHAPQRVPRRLVYVVNRRTVVDQTTVEVEKYRSHLAKAGLTINPAISTLRGQFADNREWSRDPSRPAIICGTVDMIGSRLLFGGYGLGFRAKPLHAGFLGQDCLLVHDEAHLEPAFQQLIVRIQQEQQQSYELLPFRVMELTATSRGDAEAFTLSAADDAHPDIAKRLDAVKQVRLHPLADPKKLAETLAEYALAHRESGRKVVVFARSVATVLEVAGILSKQKLPVVTLTGTMRGFERDQLVTHEVFRRFLPGASTDSGVASGDAPESRPTAYLVCTSAGEVGVNLSADHLVCDLTPFESMAQRLGRVNRFGEHADTIVDVVHPTEWDFDDAYDRARERTFRLLESLNGNASPRQLGQLDATLRQAAFSPEPQLVPATASLFDVWALTSIRQPIAGRPVLEPFLHGVRPEWEPPETRFAWRTEVDRLDDAMLEAHPPEELLELFPLRPRELLREPTDRAMNHLKKLAKRHPLARAWVLTEDGTITSKSLPELADSANKASLEGSTVLMPPSVGGLNAQGMLDGSSDEPVMDVADEPDRLRCDWDLANLTPEQTARIANMRLLRSIPLTDSATVDLDADAVDRFWHWWAIPTEGSRTSHAPVTLAVHTADVERNAVQMLESLSISAELKTAVQLAARFHDLGKRRHVFQRVLGNPRYPTVCLAKSGERVRSPLQELYRHEFGSLVDLQQEAEFQRLSPEMQALVQHLVAAHHGRGRPHWEADEAFDPSISTEQAAELARQTPVRFARLQRQFGRWGLAYLESILRAADWAASDSPSETFQESGAAS